MRVVSQGSIVETENTRRTEAHNSIGTEKRDSNHQRICVRSLEQLMDSTKQPEEIGVYRGVACRPEVPGWQPTSGGTVVA